MNAFPKHVQKERDFFLLQSFALTLSAFDKFLFWLNAMVLGSVG